MPPSPSLRGSLRRDPGGDIHKRGRSFESGLSFKKQEDDLALFNEMQSRQMENFLLESTDGFDDLLSSKTKPYPEFNLGINIAARGESSDLLNEDSDKNDYEWLLTPPETPLFPSLDDEPASVDLVHNGRARSRPISLSRSSTMEKSNRSSRGSRSPQHLSPSPRSGNITSRGRSSSAFYSNPVPLHSISPSRRQSPPPVKPSTPPPPRSLTPTSRRTTGASPVRRNRGNSASPKARAWQSSIPGFSLDAPPNLRTSLADRPASYIRGSSPASRTSRESNSKFGRQSMSPTPSRCISSSHSQERDRLSSHNKGSIASSGDDDADADADADADSFQSDPDCVHERSMPRKGVSGRPLAFPKRNTKTISPSSAPKRSFDSAIRQMDRMTPQNMFRPLLSGVPSSTIYSGKTSSTDHTVPSRITNSSNASSDLATSAACDTEGSVLSPDDVVSESARGTFSDIHDEVFVFDKMDVGPEDSRHEGHDSLSKSRLDELCVSEEYGYRDHPIESGNALICSICASRYHPDDQTESEYDNICSECKQKELSSGTPDVSQHDCQQSQSYSENSPSVLMEVEVESLDTISKQEITIEHKTDINIDVAEGSGISVLLNRSSSAKGPIVHGRAINGSAISFEDLSYARDLTSSMTSSIGHGSFSASSSISSTSTRHREMFVRRQWSGKQSDSSSKPQSTVSSFSATSVPMNRSYGHSTSSHEGSFEGTLINLRPTSPLDRVAALENAILCSKGSLVAGPSVTERNNDDVENMSQASVIMDESHLRESSCHESSFGEEVTTSDNRVRLIEIASVPPCSLSSMSEIEINDSHPSSPRSQIDVVIREDLEVRDSSTLIHHDTAATDTSLLSDKSDQPDKIAEESTVTMKDEGGRRRRSLTLEEATDTILFCSSIIHDLAYNAASIAIEKENENLKPLEGSTPTVTTIPEKSNSDRKNASRFSTGRTPKTQKPRKRRASETETEPPLAQTDDSPVKPVVRNVGLPNSTDSMKPPKLESKCNCTIM